ncbi:putative virion structural protein [Erwinia phage vB_EamM_Asesino]|uniref:Virion structural protein n=1 Tax=Erwinia phage vB_EamM_Asesino TaxID=1883370 RepID=A0A1B2I9Z8_9CAUD|nr:putative virion structural protein [Erwinia phage vB_EamM_Asesino]ANZ48080.1 putative virion structural protein [Erwinia phage vB_EamM_Asesino]
MSDKTIETSVVNILSRFPDLLRQRAESTEEFNAILNNEHITLVEQSLLGLDYLPGILEKLQIMLAANQLTAISLLVGVPEVDILGTLDKVSTQRNVLDNAARSGARLAKFAAGESSRFGLPSYDKTAIAVGESRRGGRRSDFMQGNNSKYDDYSSVGDTMNNIDASHHDNRQDNRTTNHTVNNIDNSGKNGKVAATLPSNTLKQLHEQEGLSNGKLFSVTFERDGNKVELPMQLRLAVKSLPTEQIETIIAFSDQTKTFWERVLRAKVGSLSYAKDIALCNDLIDEYRKNRFRDKSGYYRKMMEKKNGNWLSGLLSLSPSINNASSVMVVSQETIDGLSAQLGGDFDDFNVRQRVFQDTLTVYYVVVDTVWNRVTIYTRGQASPREMDKSDFSKAKAGSGDVNKIIEAYRSGAQPVL